MSLQVGTLAATLRLDTRPYEQGMAGTSATAGQAGQKAGRSFGDRMQAGVKDTLRSVGDAVANTLTAGATVAGGMFATAMVKGYSRLTTIQDATSALTISLGGAAEAGQLLDAVLGVVSGTPFNLDAFAAAAQQMVGFGIETQKVPVYLEAIGEASATQGRRAQEFADRLSTVFGQVAASGQMSLADVWRISDTGVSALAILSNHFQVTRDEMKSMISDGAVPAGEALDALAKGILEGSDGPAGATAALAGTMESLRENMSGAVAGIVPAMARIGAAVIEPWSPTVVAGANAYVDVLGLVGTTAGELSSRLASLDGVERFIAGAAGAPEVLEDLVGGLEPIAPLAIAGSGALAAMGLGGVKGLLGPLGMLVPTLGPHGPIIAGLAALVATSPRARAELREFASDARPVIESMGERLLPVLEDVVDTLDDQVPAAVAAGADALLALIRAGEQVLVVAGPVAADLLAIGAPVVVTSLELVAGALTLTADGLEHLSPLVVAGAAAWLVYAQRAKVAAAWTAANKALVVLHSTMVTAQASTLRLVDVQALASAHVEDLHTKWRKFRGTAAAGVLAVGALAAALGYAWAEWRKWQSEGRSGGQEWVDRWKEGMDPQSIDTWREAAANARAHAAGLVAEGEKMNRVFDADALTYMAEAAEELVAFADATDESVARVERDLRWLTMATGESETMLSYWARSMGHDLIPALQDGSLHIGDFATAILDARSSAADGRPAVDQLSGAIETLADETASATDMFEALKDSWDAVFGGRMSYESAIDGLRGRLAEFAATAKEAAEREKEWSATLKGDSEIALENRDRIRDLVSAAQDAAYAYGEMEGSTAAANLVLLQHREDIIKAGQAAGFSRRQMEDYLAQLGLTPDAVQTLIHLPNAGNASSELDRLHQKINGIPREVGVDVVVNVNDPRFDWNNPAHRQGVEDVFRGLQRRWGGIDHYASGGVRRQAQMGRGRNMVWWDEPATGGEAYVPRNGIPARSLGILDEAAGWYGHELIPVDLSRRIKRLAGDLTAGASADVARRATDRTAGAIPQMTRAGSPGVEWGGDPRPPDRPVTFGDTYVDARGIQDPQEVADLTSRHVAWRLAAGAPR